MNYDKNSVNDGEGRFYVSKENADEILGVMLLDLGIYPKILGFGYLKCAVKSCSADKSFLANVTSHLYPAIGEAYNVSSSSVERSIRHAIVNSIRRGRITRLNEFCGAEVFDAYYPPTNAEFIALLTEAFIMRVRRENNREFSRC